MTTEKKDTGRRDTSKLSLDEQNKIDDTIHCIQGVLELLFTAVGNSEADTEGVRFVIMDAERKLDEVRSAIEKLTAA